jgi:chorismate mutase
VEKKVLERLRLKANTYGTDPDSGADGFSKVNADAVVAMYKVRQHASFSSWNLLANCHRIGSFR